MVGFTSMVGMNNCTFNTEKRVDDIYDSKYFYRYK